MTLRSLLILSYVAVIAILAGGLAVLFDVSLGQMVQANLTTADEAMTDVGNMTTELARRRLMNHAEFAMTQRLGMTARQLHQLMASGQMSAEQVAASDVARAIAVQTILTRENIPAGQIGLYGPGAEPAIPAPTDVQTPQTDPAVLAELIAQARQSAQDQQVVSRRISRDQREWALAARAVDDSPFVLVGQVDLQAYAALVDEQIQDAARQGRKYAESNIAAAGQLSMQRIQTALITGAGTLVLLAVLFSLRFTTVVLKPLTRLREAVQQYGEGDFNVRVPQTGTGEIRQLARSFNQLGRRLDRYVEDLKQEVAARKAVEEELRIAEQIQQSLLPDSDLAGAAEKGFQLHGCNQPSRQVGGDLFDYFWLPDGRVAAIIGDVSGKGIGPALFMSMTHALLHVICRWCDKPGNALDQANRLLCEQNQAGLHVTLYIAYYDPVDGSCLTANAGHLPPLLLGPGGKVQQLQQEHGTILGLVEEAVYPTCSLQIQPGQTLLMYTDGISEARAENGQMLGEQNTIDLCARWTELGPEPLCRNLLDAAVEYQKGLLRDDVTALALRRCGA